MLLPLLAWASVAHCILTGPEINPRADEDPITAGIVNLDLIFPLNVSYTPFKEPMPIVFGLSRPDIASLLQLKVGYQLMDYDNPVNTSGGNQVFDLTKGPLPTTKGNSSDDLAFVVNFSDESIVGRVGRFRIEITMVFIAGSIDAENVITVPEKAIPIITEMFFSTEVSAADGIVPGMEKPSNGSNNCAPVGLDPFYLPFNVTDFITKDGTQYAVVSHGDFPRHHCGIPVDADTSAIIAAGPAAATTSAAASATNTAAQNSAMPGVVPGGFMTTFCTAAVLCFSMFGGALSLRI
ncbi:hypothetical protein Sste5344_009866 [Sporothrix stenoceras]